MKIGEYKILKILSETKLSKVVLTTRNEKAFVLKYSKYSNDLILDEYNVLKKLNHNNIVKVVDIFFYKKIAFLVLEYLDGYKLEYKMTKDELYHRLINIADILEYINDKGILYLDLKPNNIIINNDIKLIDFGSSIIADDKVGKLSSTKLFAPVEVYYEKDLDCRSDIFMFGKLAEYLINKSYINDKNISEIIRKSTYKVKEDRFESWYEVRNLLRKGYYDHIRSVVFKIFIILFSSSVFLAFIYSDIDKNIYNYIDKVKEYEIKDEEGIYDIEEGYLNIANLLDKNEEIYIRKLIAGKILESRINDFIFLVSIAKQYIDNIDIIGKIYEKNYLDAELLLFLYRYINYDDLLYLLKKDFKKYKYTLYDLNKLKKYIDTETYNDLERDIIG